MKPIDTITQLDARIAAGGEDLYLKVSVGVLRKWAWALSSTRRGPLEIALDYLRYGQPPLGGTRAADLASIVGVEKTHMGRILAELRRQGLVSVTGLARHTRYHAVKTPRGKS